MQPGVYVTAPAAAGSGISSTGTPYTAIQYNAAGDSQNTMLFLASDGTESIDFDSHFLKNSVGQILLDWSIRFNAIRIVTQGDYADNTAALAAGLVQGDMYYTFSGGDGILKIVL